MSENKKTNITFDSENLALPEVHTGQVSDKHKNKKDAKKDILYDDVAIPEIHIKNKKNT